MPAHVRTAKPGPLRIPAVLVGEFPLQHEDLLPAPAGVALKAGTGGLPAHQRHILGIAALGLQGPNAQPLDQPGPPT